MWKDASPTGAHPVQQVNWDDAVLFCNWLSVRDKWPGCYVQKTNADWTRDAGGAGYRLPTEAEWEYACRAGTTTEFSSGDDESLLARYAVFAERSAEPCGSRLPNGWGLFDMHGNVWEWCEDWYGEYGRNDVEDPIGPPQGSFRVYRGGS